MYTDRSLTCADCGQEFTFTAGEQEFYAQRGFTEVPKRCSSCRQIRKSQRNRSSDGGGSRDSYGGGNGGYGDSSYSSGDSGGANSGSGYSASGGYSSGGYSGGGGGGGGYSGGGGGYSSERRQREMFDAVCANCGKTASVPFRPSGSKPVYCSDCFESRR